MFTYYVLKIYNTFFTKVRLIHKCDLYTGLYGKQSSHVGEITIVSISQLCYLICLQKFI